MSSVAGIAMAAVAANQAQTQMALAAKMTKMNAEAQNSIVALLEAASANGQEAANAVLEAGVGGQVDISA
ncbi:MAG: hypothetical protein OEM91_02275 [Hyphomicrobiales bacterium]|nr:hypothetical protein [Hyphomicrobiales bacterium]